MEDTSQCSEDGLDKQEEADGLAEDSDPPPAKLKWKKCAEKRVKKSPVWKYFKKCPDVADVCLCLTCGARVKSCVVCGVWSHYGTVCRRSPVGRTGEAGRY